MDPNQFRLDFPEFDNATVYPDTNLLFWSTIAAQLIDMGQWASLYNQAVELFVAHNIALAAQERAQTASGGIPGSANGVIAAKTVGNVSVNYDNTDVMEPGAGHWNQTTYGRQYIRLARMIGQGCLQL